MSRIAIFFAEGYEEIEGLTVVDICRRAGLAIDMVSVTGKQVVPGSHGIAVTMDKLYEEVDISTYDMLVLPGGKAGVEGLEAHEALMDQVDAFYKAGKYVAAICAAPSILGHRGILQGKKACSYPSFEGHLTGATVTAGPVEIAGNVITSRGMGTSIDFALAIVGELLGAERAKELADTIVYRGGLA